MKPLRNLSLSIISGVLIALSFPNFFIPFLFVPGFLILLYLLYNSPFKSAVFYIFLSGFVFSLISFYWVNNAIVHYGNVNFLVSIILYVILAAAFSFVQFVIPGVFSKFLINRYLSFGLLSFPFIWVWVEIGREFIPFSGFPWNLAGYMITYINPLAQITEFVGIYGASFIAIALPTFAFYYFLNRNIFSFLLFGIVILVFIGAGIYGFIKIKNFIPEGEKYKVAILQGNIPEEMKQDIKQREKVLDIYISLFKQAAKEKPDLIVFPESALPFPPLDPNDPLRKKFFEEIKDIKVAFLAGFDNYFTLKGKFYLYNSIFLYDENHYSVYFYNKIKLVPFGEYLPRFFEPFKKFFPYLQGYDFSKGKEITTLNYKKMRIIPLICFEAIFSSFVGNFVKKGGNIIVNITNDAWFGKSSAPFQHFEMARVRAIEYGLYMVRAANTGISAFVNPVGKIEKSLGLFKRGYIVSDVYVKPYPEPTFYLRYRKLLLLTFFVATLVVLLFKERDYLDRIRRRQTG